MNHPFCMIHALSLLALHSGILNRLCSICDATWNADLVDLRYLVSQLLHFNNVGMFRLVAEQIVNTVFDTLTKSAAGVFT